MFLRKHIEGLGQTAFGYCHSKETQIVNEHISIIVFNQKIRQTIEFLMLKVYFVDMVLHDACWRKPEVQKRSNACYKDHVETVKSQLEQISMLDDAYTDQVKQKWCK